MWGVLKPGSVERKGRLPGPGERGAWGGLGAFFASRPICHHALLQAAQALPHMRGGYSYCISTLLT